jgi:Prokaryotic E2 family E
MGEVADVAILIQANYPAAQIDSAYIFPPLARMDGRPIPNATGLQTIDDRKWQFWSRHRTPANPWIAGEDDLAAHILWMESWLAGELERTT